MQIFTGIDIIEVNRIKEAIERQGENFLKKVYTKKEINYCKRYWQDGVPALCGKICCKRSGVQSNII